MRLKRKIFTTIEFHDQKLALTRVLKDHGISDDQIYNTIVFLTTFINVLFGISVLMKHNFNRTADDFVKYIKKKNPEILVGKFPDSILYKNRSAYFQDFVNDKDPESIKLKKKLCDPEFCKENDIDPQRLTKEMDWWAKAAIEDRPLIMYGKDNSYPVIAHEYGHFLFGKTEKGSTLQNEKYNQGIHSKKFIGFVSGLLGLAGWSGVIISPLVGALLYYPVLCSEFQASYRGIEEMEKFNAPEEDIKKAKLLLAEAYGTYLTTEFLVTFAVSGAVRKMIEVFKG